MNSTMKALTTIASLTAVNVSAQASWLINGNMGAGGVNRTIWDYSQGSSVVTNPRVLTTANLAIAGIEYVNGTTYAMNTFNDNRFCQVNFTGASFTETPLTPALGSSAEGDVGYNPADGFFYALENTPNAATKKIWRINPLGWTATIAASFTADDPSGIAFDNSGAAFVVDTHANSGGTATLLSFDVMSSPGAAIYLSTASLGMSVGPGMGLDFDPTTNDMYFVTFNGGFYKVGAYASANPTPTLIDTISGVDRVMGLAYVPVPEPASVGLLALGAVAGVLRRRGAIQR